MPVSTPTSVDLPAPLRPTSARESPAGTRTETLLSAWFRPKRLETPSTSTIAGAGAPSAPAAGGMVAIARIARMDAISSSPRLPTAPDRQHWPW